jgi:hypothetical protein
VGAGDGVDNGQAKSVSAGLADSLGAELLERLEKAALPPGPADWLLRVTPAAAFAIQQSTPQYAQVSSAYTPFSGYYPLAPWAGFAVLCGYAALAMALAIFLLRQRDV